MKLKLSFSITIYLIGLFIIAFFALNIDSLKYNTFGFLVYLFLITGALYFFLSRYSCFLKIDGGSTLHIRYLMPWIKNIDVNLKEYKYLDYGRGFYAAPTDRENGYMNLLRHPYDTVILSKTADSSSENIQIKVNLRAGQFKKLLAYLQVSEGLSFLKSDGKGNVFW